MKNDCLILDIKGNSLDDGPGIRSVVFFKGCPLNCVWCHNPESKSIKKEIAFYSKECIDCGICQNSCELKAISKENQYHINRELCNLCMKCSDDCPTGALMPVGADISVSEVAKKLLKDKPFYINSDGGITISGGEATLYMPYLEQLLKKLKAEGVHILLETCGFFKYEEFLERVYPYLDSIYFDIKLIDNEKHKQYCCVSNTLIKDNFARLHKKYLEGDVFILPRTPLIPDITDTVENITAIGEFYKEHGVKQAALLEYNPLWHDKNTNLGIENSISKIENMRQWTPKEKILECQNIMENYGLKLV